MASARISITATVDWIHGFAGGETSVPELKRRIEPRHGRTLLFQHRVLHEAPGRKRILRTDVTYRR